MRGNIENPSRSSNINPLLKYKHPYQRIGYERGYLLVLNIFIQTFHFMEENRIVLGGLKIMG